MRNITTQAVLILSVPDGLTDQEAFNQVNNHTAPFGVDFIFPANVQRDLPAIVVRVLRSENPAPPKI